MSDFDTITVRFKMLLHIAISGNIGNNKKLLLHREIDVISSLYL